MNYDDNQLAQGIKPKAENNKLNNIIEDIFKGQKISKSSRKCIGNGTTMDAIRNELRTGEPTGGYFHSSKGESLIVAINKLLNENILSEKDASIAQTLLKDLINALGKE